MKSRVDELKITDEVLAAYFDGEATLEEYDAVIEALGYDEELREIMSVARKVDAEVNLNMLSSFSAAKTNRVRILPLEALAAKCDDANICCVECEKHILKSRGVEFDEVHILEVASENNWQKSAGTALHNVGRHLENYGMYVTRRYQMALADIVMALEAGDDVIVAVNQYLLAGVDASKEQISKPDHVVVVLSVDTKAGTIRLFDPNEVQATVEHPIARFKSAWAVSENYLVASNVRGAKEYDPCPIDITDVELSPEIVELREAIAENAHEIWAQNRRAEGWTYGPERNDTLKQSPDLVPYAELADGEKMYDREMAMQTIKLMYKLGYEVVKVRK